MNEQELPPPPIADIAAGIAKTSAIIAAGQLGLFKILAERPRSISEIASVTGASETGVARLVEALAR